MTKTEVQQELVNALEQLSNVKGLVVGTADTWAVAEARGHINDALAGLSELTDARLSCHECGGDSPICGRD